MTSDDFAVEDVPASWKLKRARRQTKNPKVEMTSAVQIVEKNHAQSVAVRLHCVFLAFVSSFRFSFPMADSGILALSRKNGEQID